MSGRKTTDESAMRRCEHERDNDDDGNDNDADDADDDDDDDVFATDDEVDGERNLFEVVSGMARDMSRDIVTSSLSSFSPAAAAAAAAAATSAGDIPGDDDDFDEDRRLSRDILEEWEPETSESGSYVIENFAECPETTSTRPLRDRAGDDNHGDDFDIDDDDLATSRGGILDGKEETLAGHASPLLRHVFHGNEKQVVAEDRLREAARRLTDLLATCEPFQESVQRKPTTNELKAPEKIKTGKKKEEVKEEEAKVKLEEWNFRLDRLLERHSQTNGRFIRALCQPRGSNSFDNLNFSEDEDIEDEKMKNFKPAVEFNPGLHCTDVNQAHDILTTRYKLNDVKKKRSIISWSRWNLAHVVRGPHAQSPIWKPNFMEEVEKSKKVMEELNRTIDAREANLQKLADNQTLDFYSGLALRCFERQHQQQSDQRNLHRILHYGSLKPRKKSKENVAGQAPRHINEHEQEESEGQGLRSNSLSSLPSTTPHQPQQSDHIKCFTFKNSTDRESSKPSIIDFVKQANQTGANLSKLQSQSVSSKISDEGYDDDVFYRDDEPQGRGASDIQRPPKSHQSRSQPLLNYFGNSQLLQIVSQQNRNKMKKRSQQRRRQLKKKMETSLPKQDCSKKTTSSQQSTPIQPTKTFKQTFNCMSGQGDSKFNSLRIIRKKTPNPQSTHPSTPLPLTREGTQKQEGTNVFSKFYQWFHGKVSGKEF